MFNIGLTGGIGSGKSRVADMLAEWGAALVDTDEIARSLTAAGGAAMPAIEREFGPQALTPDGALDRAWMRTQAFADPQVRRRPPADRIWSLWCRYWLSPWTVGVTAWIVSAWSIAIPKRRWLACSSAAG